GRWILCQTPEGLLLIDAAGGATRALSREEWFAYAWAADGRKVYGLRNADDLHHFLLASVDVETGRETVINPNLRAMPQATPPIRGLARIRTDGFLTSIARVRSDIWLLEGFDRAGRFRRFF